VSGDFKIGSRVVQPSLNSIVSNGTAKHLEPKMMEVLVCLAQKQGEVISKEQLIRAVWPDTFVTDDVLTRCISELRRVFRDDPKEPKIIQTIPKRGYRLVATVNQVTPAPGARRWSRLWDRRIWGMLAIAVGLATAWVMTRPTPVPRLVRIARLTDSGAVMPNQKLLTDGTRLYFFGQTNGRRVARWMSTSGGAGAPIALPFDADLQDISPDGSEILIRELREHHEGDLWTISTSGGAPRRLAVGDTEGGTYTRDGHRLLYSKGSAVYACDRDGGNRRRIVSLPGDAYGIILSPQGDRLRFYVDQGPDEGVVLWESKSDGAALHRVIEDWPRPRWEWGGGWSPDGRWFTFSARRDAGSDVWLLRESGLLGQRAVPVRLTSGPMDFIRPIFSHEGKRIFAVGATRRGELMRYDFKKREFTQFLGGISAENVAFSPDKMWVIYVSYPDGRLWRARADGSQPEPLTVPPMRVGWAFWSPDGSKIAFEGRPMSGSRWSTYVISSAGGAPEQVATNTNPGGLTWRPDSKGLIFANWEGTSPLQVVDLESHSITALPGTERAVVPSLSPSGRYLVAKMKGLNTLVLFDLARQRNKQLPMAVTDTGYLSWSQHERYVYFIRGLGAEPLVYCRASIADGSISRLMEWKEFTPAGSTGAWSTIAPDGSLLFLRDLGGADLYAIDWSEH
jgi:DNA-binding winged helix-turn-helix (wHTH) protein/Tol biopolymer transport system component